MSIVTYKRPVYHLIRERVLEERKFIQILTGPRQSGKTTLAQQVAEDLPFPVHYASADSPTLQDNFWIEQQWELARLKANQSSSAQCLLILDEIQKIPSWSETVKKMWDEDTKRHISLKVMLLGSSPLLIQRGLSESLAGRFEHIPITHWSYPEMRDAFGLTAEEYMYFGGYPGSAGLIHDETRWKEYITGSLIETTISKDILLLTRIDKPALLRRLFFLGCEYSGQILSFQKMLGQLQDAGNTTTLSHYLNLLTGAGMLTEIKKYAGETVRRRGSSPKLQVMNMGLKSALSSQTFQSAQADGEYWGKLTESAIGAHLVNSSAGKPVKVYYWRDRGREVDFVLESGNRIVAFEVKSGKKKQSLPGLKAFDRLFHPVKTILVGSGGVPIEEFLSQPPAYWFE